MILYCAKCDFELPDGAACNTSKCPDCGELHLRLWDTSDGTLPGKRPFEISNSEYWNVSAKKAPPKELIVSKAMTFCKHCPDGFVAPFVCAVCEEERKNKPVFTVMNVTENSIEIVTGDSGISGSKGVLD